jgi:phosphoribosylamine--glycine ligase
MLAVARGDSIRDWQPRARPGAALTTVLAAGGYPGTVQKGNPIALPASVPEDVIVFHAGTALQDGQLVTAGGRVLAVTGLGDSLAEAATASRAVAEQITFDGRQFRRDIGWRELARRHAGDA